MCVCVCMDDMAEKMACLLRCWVSGGSRHRAYGRRCRGEASTERLSDANQSFAPPLLKNPKNPTTTPASFHFLNSNFTQAGGGGGCEGITADHYLITSATSIPHLTRLLYVFYVMIPPSSSSGDFKGEVVTQHTHTHPHTHTLPFQQPAPLG